MAGPSQAMTWCVVAERFHPTVVQAGALVDCGETY